jgi:hypothetical protein
MTSPRHLWSGDWRRDSEEAAAERARRRPRDLPEHLDEVETRTREREPREPRTQAHEAPTIPRQPEPLRPEPRRPEPRRPEQRRPARHGPSTPPKAPRREPAGATLKAARARLKAVIASFRARERAPAPERRRAALLIVLAALIVGGAAYGLAVLGGSGGSDTSVASSGQPWIGAQLSMPLGGGVIVDSVSPGGPAARAGIAPGDVIMAIGSRPVNTPADVDSTIDNMSVGQEVPITVLRGANSYTTLVKLSGRPLNSP